MQTTINKLNAKIRECHLSGNEDSRQKAKGKRLKTYKVLYKNKNNEI